MAPLCPIEDFLAFIRKDQRISAKALLAESSRLEQDLGITGDDGSDLLEAIEQQFGISFTTTDFGIGEDQYLFHSEGVLWTSENVMSITVGNLHRATCRSMARKQEML